MSPTEHVKYDYSFFYFPQLTQSDYNYGRICVPSDMGKLFPPAFSFQSKQTTLPSNNGYSVTKIHKENIPFSADAKKKKNNMRNHFTQPSFHAVKYSIQPADLFKKISVQIGCLPEQHFYAIALRELERDDIERRGYIKIFENRKVKVLASKMSLQMMTTWQITIKHVKLLVLRSCATATDGYESWTGIGKDNHEMLQMNHKRSNRSNLREIKHPSLTIQKDVLAYTEQ